MKVIHFMLFCFFVIGCNSNKRVAEKEKQVQLNINCPEGGNCVFEVLENSSLQLKFDDSGNLYPEVISGDKTVIKFHYKKFEIENTADSSHSEYIYLEINKSEKQLILKDHELQEVKLLFGRICFCRGSMGYFKVTQGDLFLFNHNGKLQIDLKFKVNKVPQIITEIKENINY